MAVDITKPPVDASKPLATGFLLKQDDVAVASGERAQGALRAIRQVFGTMSRSTGAAGMNWTPSTPLSLHHEHSVRDCETVSISDVPPVHR
jgi:hypothetical protein